MSSFWVNRNYLSYGWFIVSRRKTPDCDMEVYVEESYGYVFYCDDKNKLIEVTRGYAPIMRQSDEYIELGPIE